MVRFLSFKYIGKGTLAFWVIFKNHLEKKFWWVFPRLIFPTMNFSGPDIFFYRQNEYPYWICIKSKKFFRILAPKTSRRIWQKVIWVAERHMRMLGWGLFLEERTCRQLRFLSPCPAGQRSKSRRRCCLRVKTKCMRVHTCWLLSPGQSNIRYSAIASHISSQNEGRKKE